MPTVTYQPIGYMEQGISISTCSFVYCLYKKSCSILYRKLLYKYGQDFLDILYNFQHFDIDTLCCYYRYNQLPLRDRKNGVVSIVIAIYVQPIEKYNIKVFILYSFLYLYAHSSNILKYPVL